MMRVFFYISFLFILTQNTFAQPKTRQDLEKERAQLRLEIESTKELQEKVKSATKDNLNTLIVFGRKAELQDRVVDNINKDINLLDNNIYGIQRDINKYDKLLDTLRQEYAKSMVYAYKNRGNYEFLNFIFSAENFNDAVKRIAYLKSYRTFREMQGQNILRTQELRKKRLEDLGVTKKTKTTTLTVQAQELKNIEDLKLQQDKIVENLRKQGKTIDALIAEKKRREAKINGAIKKAIAKAIKDDNDRKIAFAKAEKAKSDAIAKENIRLAKIKKAADDKVLADAKAKEKIASIKVPPVTTTNTGVKPPPIKINTPAPNPVVIATPKAPEPSIYTSPSTILNANFEKNRGSLPWPVDSRQVILHFGPYKLPSGLPGGFNTAISIQSAVGAVVKSVFDGEVILVEEMEYGKYTVTVKHGKYYTSYSNINSVQVKLGQEIKIGQQLGKVAVDINGIGSIDFSLAREYSDINPELWLRR